eukprot:m.863251 g.863251  ORF g.863251 m.863251 type:complete len:1100 (+) comp23541_c0_seq7:417-3716(+)
MKSVILATVLATTLAASASAFVRPDAERMRLYEERFRRHSISGSGSDSTDSGSDSGSDDYSASGSEESTSAPTASPTAAISFSEVLPRGCCRNAEGGTGVSEYRFGLSQAECEELCLDTFNCAGYEINDAGKCELHRDAADFTQTNDVSTCGICVEKINDFGTTEEVGFTLVDSGGCCNAPTAPFVSTAFDLGMCLRICSRGPNCVGVEFNETTKVCSRYQQSSSVLTADGGADCNCYRYSPRFVSSVTLSPTEATTGAPVTVSPTASPTAAGVTFVELLPQGCCRTPTGNGVDKEIVFGQTLASCEQLCLDTFTCTAFEFSVGKCELFREQPTFTAASGTCNCVDKQGEAGDPSDVGFVQVTDTASFTPVNLGCCEGPAGFETVVVSDIGACLRMCVTMEGCMGAEFNENGNTCELHNAPDGLLTVDGNPTCSCYRGPAFETQAPTESPVGAPTAATDAPTTDAPVTAAPSTEAPTATPGSISFVELEPQGCCRNAAGQSGISEYFFQQDRASCEDLCSRTFACMGYEIGASGKCELKRENDFNRTNPDASCNCVEKVGEAGDPSDVGFGQVIVIPFGSGSFAPAASGCCTGPAGYSVRRAFDLAACLRMCDDDETCVGAEFKSNGLRCELHSAAAGLLDVDGTAGCSCWTQTERFAALGETTGAAATTEVTSAAAVTSDAPTAGSGISFTEILPQGCCRTSTGGNGISEYLFGTTIEECETTCLATFSCTAFEMNDQGKCELKRGDDFDRTKPDTDCNCLLKTGQSGDPSDVGFSQVGSGAETSGLVAEIENNGCCVGGPLGIVSRRMDLGECLRSCLEMPGCLGADYNTANKRCELHTTTESLLETDDTATCSCWVMDARFSPEEENDDGSGSDYSVSGETDAPVTASPTTAAPTTATPTTAAPTTVAPTTAAPTTSAPTEPVGEEPTEIDFVTLQPQGCCRSESGSNGMKEYIFGITQAQCEEACAMTFTCRGYEHSAAKCELMRDEDDFDHTNPDSSCECVEKTGETGTPTDVGYSMVAESGCCAGAGARTQTAFDIGTCVRICSSGPNCKGISFNAATSSCTIHTSSSGLQAVDDSDMCYCLTNDERFVSVEE